MVMGIVVLVVSVLVALNWYVWRRIVRDTTARGSLLRRAGTLIFVAGPLLAVVVLAGGHGRMPFWLERALAWPVFLWLAFALYLLLTLLVLEFVRPLLQWWRARRDAVRATSRNPVPETVREQPDREPEPGREGRGSARRPEPALAGAARPGMAALADTAGDGGAVAVAGSEPPAEKPVSGTASGPTAEATADPPSGPPAGAAGGDAADPDPHLSRRLFVSRVMAGVAVATAAGIVGVGTRNVLRGPRVKSITVPLAKLPRSAHGFRITVVSDIHLGPVLGRDFARTVVDTINSTQPDLIAIVGDMVDGDVDDLAPIVAPLKDLRSRHGTHFVTGNHEYISGAAQWIDYVQELGMRLMANTRRELPGFDIAGVHDIRGRGSGEGPDFAAALGDRDRSRAAILLAHQPVVIHESVRYGVDLQLSGHTHGGQLWPGPYIASMVNPTLAGLERYGDTQLYVTRGAGAAGPPVRVGAPSDITVVTLASPQA